MDTATCTLLAVAACADCGATLAAIRGYCSSPTARCSPGRADIVIQMKAQAELVPGDHIATAAGCNPFSSCQPS